MDAEMQHRDDYDCAERKKQQQRGADERSRPMRRFWTRAHFLNQLLLRKSFSWTAVMMDLENVLPTGVQVTAIEPQVTADGDVDHPAAGVRVTVTGRCSWCATWSGRRASSRRDFRPRNLTKTKEKRDRMPGGYQRGGSGRRGVRHSWLKLQSAA